MLPDSEYGTTAVPVFVYDGVEEPAVPPGGGEVVAADPHVAIRHLLGPEQKPLLGRHVLRLARHVDLRDLGVTHRGGHRSDTTMWSSEI